MIKLSNIRVSPQHGNNGVKAAAAKALKTSEENLGEVIILKRSIDARKKTDVHYLYSLAVNVKNEDKFTKRGFDRYIPKDEYTFPSEGKKSDKPVVIVGMGPGGLFAAYTLTMAGIKCIILERGKCVEERTADIEKFWAAGELDENSNVQFGEGGAGTFSDGKLTTGINDGRIPYVLKTFVENGAPDDILYLAKPHIGTDNLRIVVANMRNTMVACGCDVRFGAKMTGLNIENGAVRGVEYECGGKKFHIEADHVVLALGNSARDTFKMLRDLGVKMSKKNFAVGVRIEHKQADINMSQYGQAATLGTLPASDYKLAVHLPSGRSAYTFCVCPGGRVVASASQCGGVVTNGMSQYARDEENCAGGLLVGVTAEDFDEDVLSGMYFQDKIEHDAFIHGGENYFAPAQLVGDFLSHRPSTGAKNVKPTYTPGVKWCNLWDVLPDFVCETLESALPQMEKKVHGFAAPDAVLTAVESRSSCPIRMDREDFMAVGIYGLYPCGEGAGYAGGITSASVDGIRCAEAVYKNL